MVASMLSSSLGNLSDVSISALWSLGFGSVNEQTLLHLSSVDFSNLVSSSTLLPTILIANLPQLILTFLYFTYNALFTCMLMAHEWNGYAYERKALRVTSVQGQQRSTYWLQLPYRYSLPLMIMSGLLHWLTSQSLFLARITLFDEHGNPSDEYSVSTCGYSPIAIVLLLVPGGCVFLPLGIISFRRYRPGIPLVRSCSAAISAACHRPDADEQASLRPVMWGVVGYEFNEDLLMPIGRCSFTSYDIEAPIKGKLYGSWESKWQSDEGKSSLTVRDDIVGRMKELLGVSSEVE